MFPKVSRSVATHSGVFHADDVTACALLCVFGLVDRDLIVRSREPNQIAQCEYVCDVGGVYDPKKKLFDHHQEDYKGDMASAGMVLLYLKEQNILTAREYDFLNGTFVFGVDAHDNGRSPQPWGYASFSHILASFVPPEYDVTAEVLNRAFFVALDFVVGYLHRLQHRFKYVESCRDIVKEAMDHSKDCLIFDKGIPWLESFFDLGGEKHPAKFVIMPAGEHWKLRAIPPSYENRMQVRVPLPAAWAGLLEKDLERVSGMPGAVFCHKGRFVSVWKTKEDALRALDYVLKQIGGQ